MADPESAPRVHAETRSQWREWLLAHHETAPSVWLISWKKATGRAAVSYDDAVSEALAVGWVDSKPPKLDEERTMLYFSPRKPGSAWSRPNKLRVEQLRRSGAMTDAGERVIAQAVASGAWTLLDQVEDLIVPEDLEEAFTRTPPARQNWDQFPPSARRGILEWIIQAKRPATREARISETARQAALNQRANQWPPREVADLHPDRRSEPCLPAIGPTTSPTDLPHPLRLISPPHWSVELRVAPGEINHSKGEFMSFFIHRRINDM